MRLYSVTRADKCCSCLIAARTLDSASVKPLNCSLNPRNYGATIKKTTPDRSAIGDCWVTEQSVICEGGKVYKIKLYERDGNETGGMTWPQAFCKIACCLITTAAFIWLITRL